MKIIIDIPEEEYKCVQITGHIGNATHVSNAIFKGTPLPKGHGRLIDADKTLAVAWQNFYRHEDEWEEKDEDYVPLHRFYDQNGFECCQQTIVNAPTIIEAESKSEEKE